jgi:hypothetical protein
MVEGKGREECVLKAVPQNRDLNNFFFTFPSGEQSHP